MSRDRRRRLTAEERALWSTVTRSVVPLCRPPAESESAEAEAALLAPAPRSEVAEPKPTPKASSVPPPAPPLAPLDRRTRQRLVRAKATIDARIDLHGLKQSEAHAALRRFLRTAQADGARIVLVITGKGGRADGDPSSERGVLRRQVPLWLEGAELRPLVIGFEPAHPGHGGEGALYVRIRRAR